MTACYLVLLDTGAEVTVEADDSEDACRLAEENAAADGYPGIAAVRAQPLN